jgi:transposase
VVHIVLSDEEKEVLREYFKTTLLIRIRLKSQAILLRDKSMKVEDISDVLGRNTRTIERWIRDVKHTRLASLFTGYKDNENASKLTREQKEEIKRILSDKPSLYGLPREFWNTPQLKKYVKTKFGIVYESERSYHLYFLRTACKP